MKVGTKSALFGVHSFWFHWLPVGLAWRRLYGVWPRWNEWVAIFFHDFPGYWGCDDMDGECGVMHPRAGAEWAAGVVAYFSKSHELMEDTFFLSLLHSRTYCASVGMAPSKLCAADKASIFFTPEWLYLLQAHATGEIKEYIRNGPPGMQECSSRAWLHHYKLKTLDYLAGL